MRISALGSSRRRNPATIDKPDDNTTATLHGEAQPQTAFALNAGHSARGADSVVNRTKHENLLFQLLQRMVFFSLFSLFSL